MLKQKQQIIFTCQLIYRNKISKEETDSHLREHLKELNRNQGGSGASSQLQGKLCFHDAVVVACGSGWPGFRCLSVGVKPKNSGRAPGALLAQVLFFPGGTRDRAVCAGTHPACALLLQLLESCKYAAGVQEEFPSVLCSLDVNHTRGGAGGWSGGGATQSSFPATRTPWQRRSWSTMSRR